MTKFCKNCGSELDEGSVFCDECGTRVGQSNPQRSAGNNVFRKYNIDMLAGEEIIKHSVMHSGCLIPPLLVFCFGIFLGFVLISDSYFYYPIFMIFCFLNIFTVVGLIWFIIRLIGYKTNDLILTNKRVFGKCGLIFTTQMQSPLNKIDSVSYSQGILGKIIGYGTVQIATISSKFKFRFIREGETFYNDIFNQLEHAEVENRDKDAKAIADAMAEKLS